MICDIEVENARYLILMILLKLYILTFYSTLLVPIHFWLPNPEKITVELQSLTIRRFVSCPTKYSVFNVLRIFDNSNCDNPNLEISGIKYSAHLTSQS